MTHYTMNYSTLTPQEKYNKAIEDSKEWLGPRFDAVLKCISGFTEYEAAELALSFAGIQGYPCKALYDIVRPYG
jgi:hypothetical protein